MKVKWRFKPNSLERLKDGDFIVCKNADAHYARKVINITRRGDNLYWDAMQWVGGKVHIDRGHGYMIDDIDFLTHGQARALQSRYGRTNYPDWYFDPSFDIESLIKNA